LNHEYVHCPFWQERAQAKSKGGYHDEELPQWFIQGIAEYVSENYLPSYEKHVRRKIQQGLFDVDRPYSWGLYIVEYLYQTFQHELGLSYTELREGWKQYLISKFR